MNSCNGWKRTAVTLVALAAASAATAQSFGGGSRDRGGRWEAFAGAKLLLSDSADFTGGTTIDTEDDLGFDFGFGYNLNDHWLVTGEMTFNSVSYDGDLISAEDPPEAARRISGELDTASIGAGLTWHLFEGPVTPYASALLGWTWIDTNIATGPPQVGCWWDPWWGYICTPVTDTVSDDALSYGLGLGLRWDIGAGAFGRLGYEQRWLDIKNADGTPDFGTIRLEFGSKF